MGDLRRIRLLALDVDGILTDGTLFVGEDGATFKRFSILDGAGIKYFLRSGLEIALISGHASKTVEYRARSLGITEVHLGVEDKLRTLLDLLARTRIKPDQVAAMGDDVMDLPMLRAVGFRATVPEAHACVIDVADYVTVRPGGHGAVREVIEKILDAKGLLSPFHHGGLT